MALAAPTLAGLVAAILRYARALTHNLSRADLAPDGGIYSYVSSLFPERYATLA
jgi:hypothetical protein